MAKAKGKGKGKGKSAAKRPSGKRNPKNPKRRARRNPAGGFGDRAMKLLGGAAVVVATGIGVTYAMSKLDPGSNVSTYGIPLVTFGVGAALARKMPVLGGGMALGAATPFVLPLTSRVLALGQPTPATTAAGLGRMLNQMRSVHQLGAVQRGNLGAVDSRYRAAYA
jgi:hypothetical protein